MNKPKLIVVTGRPGSGKTTLAKKLGNLLYLPVVSRDEIKEGYVNTFNIKHDKLPEDTNKIASETFFKTIELLISKKVSVVAEAAFQHKIWQPEIAKLENISEVIVVLCEVDKEVAAKRHLDRGLNDSKREFYHGDNRVTHYKKTGEFLLPGDYEALKMDVRTIKVSTKEEYNPTLEKVADDILKN